MVKVGLRLLLVPLLVCLGACDTVTSPTPMGTSVLQLEAADWDGRWSNAEGDMDVTVTDPAKGLIHVEFPDGDHLRVLDLQLRTAGAWTFVSTTEDEFDKSQGLGDSADDNDPGSGAAEGFLWARIKKDGDMIIAWVPDAKAFAALVEQQRLPGSVEEGHVALGKLQAADYAKITAGELGMVLDWENPAVLYRLKASEAPDPQN